MPISAGIAVASATVGAVTQIKDTQKRREVELALSRLSARDQKALNEKIARTSSQNDRLALLLQEVNKQSIEQQKESQRRQTRNAFLIVGASVVVLLAIVILKRK